MEFLGDYTIQKSLGQGPFGSIYLAEHRFIRKQFVLKVLPDEVSQDPSFLRRFEAEVARIAALDHPNIVKIHNVSCSDGRYFLVMDPVLNSAEEIMDLDAFLDISGKGMQEETLFALLRQVATALDFAHEQGVIHGCLKPSNILVKLKGQKIELLLSDFGITRLIGEGAALLSVLTEIGHSLVLHTQKSTALAVQKKRLCIRDFAFLSPEQKALDGEIIDEKADAYAFGVLGYYLIARKLPEGCFELPSRLLPDAKGNWDLFLHRCLQVNSSTRSQKLLLAMDEYLSAPQTILQGMHHLSEVGEKLEQTAQLGFAFPSPQEASLEEVLQVSEPLKPILKPQELTRPEYDADPAAIFQRDLHVSHYVPTKVEIREIEPLLTDMVIIPGGSYLRGSTEGARDELPRHAVRLPSFALDVAPVTNEQFVRFLQAMGGEKDQHNNDIIRLRDARIKRAAGKLTIESGYAKHPVVGVTWYGASAYAKWVGKRLPFEAEWESAASGGKDNFIFPTGLDIDRTQANFFSSDTTPVMSYPPNSFGIYDMAGNVYEWCQDWYAYNYYDTSSVEPDQPKGPNQGVYRVLRGGCWKSLREDLRSSHRHRNNPGAVNGTYGFRCAADVQ